MRSTVVGHEYRPDWRCIDTFQVQRQAPEGVVALVDAGEAQTFEDRYGSVIGVWIEQRMVGREVEIRPLMRVAVHRKVVDAKQLHADLVAEVVRGDGFHDTDRRMHQLCDALRTHPDHRWLGEVQPVAEAVLQTWADWEGPSSLPDRIGHGDLKISNVRFTGSGAVALIDLDTLARGTPAAELGDAFRSCCNRSRQGEPPRFDLELFSAGIRGYASRAAAVTAKEYDSIVPGIVQVMLA